jgi:RNA polymerase sigma-70 factor (ECF subfamily)
MASIAASPALLPLVRSTNAENQDTDLLRRAAQGEGDAFYELFRPCELMMYRAAFAMLGNKAIAEEVCQEAAFKAFRSIGKFRGDCKFSTWIVQIVFNEARMRLRKEKQERLVPLEPAADGMEHPMDPPDERESALDALSRRELRSALIAAIQTLPEIYRSVFVLRDVQHLTIAETAGVLGLSLSAVKTRLLRARLRMRTAMLRWEQTGSVGARTKEATLVEQVIAFLDAY